MSTKRIEHFTETLARGELSPLDFMMMDMHRPMTDEEIEAVNPQALLDKSAGAVENNNGDAASVGAPHKEEPRRYSGPFVVYPDNVEVLDVNTSCELDVARVLQSAHDNGLSRVLVIGTREGDNELFVLCSDPDIAEANLLTDRAKLEILNSFADGRLREDPRGPKEQA